MYQIEVRARSYGQQIDMSAVCEALRDLMTDDQTLSNGDEARTHNRVYVQFAAVEQAVARINALGYDTDEDAS